MSIMKITSFSLLLIGLLSCTPTAQKTNIKSISVSTYGGDRGYSRTLKITKDSIFDSTTDIADSTKNTSTRILNTQYKLQDLITEEQLNELSKVKNGQSNQLIDATDTTLTIETNKETFKITNADDNPTWKKIVDNIYDISSH